MNKLKKQRKLIEFSIPANTGIGQHDLTGQLTAWWKKQIVIFFYPELGEGWFGNNINT